MRKATLRFVASAFAVVGLLFAAPAAQASFNQNAMIFVHGFVGSGAQFESQKMRFTSNGYPGDYVTVLEYDSTFGTETRQQVFLRLDAQIAALQQQTGRPQVDILAHSLGTSVMQEYLNSSAERAADVGHYVNIDGQTATAPPGGVPTLAVWAGRGTPGRQITGAQNVTIPNQTHVQTATSAESFVEYYKFFTGASPLTPHIVRETGPITIAGRAVLFPENSGLVGATVEVWELDDATGQRLGSSPVGTAAIGTTGDFGPITVLAGKRYELALLRPGAVPQHTYYEPFVRSDHLIRLLDNDALEAAVEKSLNHSAGLVIRYKELWGDQGSESDILAMNGTNVCNAATCPIGHQVNAMFFMDEGSDGQTDLSAPNPVFFALPFISGVDIFLPAATPPIGTTSFQLTSRGEGPVRTVNVPNYASLTNAIVVQLDDFDETVSSAYARPGSATPMRVSLVPEYEECTTPNSTHVAPLDLPSCSPTAPRSTLVTMGKQGRGSAWARFNAIVGNPATPSVDEADLGISAAISDVRSASGGGDYTGKVVLTTQVRLTDSNSGAGESPATASDFEVSVPIDCIATAAPERGSNCNVNTTLDTLVPGSMSEGARSVISTFSVNVEDPGADGNIAPSSDPLGIGCPPTCGSGDERVFLRQGVFAP